MNEMKIINAEVCDQADVTVEFSETITPEPITIVHCCSARELHATIDLLNERKSAAVAAFDAEIAINQTRLESMQAATADVKLVAAPAMVAEEM